jgi:hypothetical protein
MIDLDLNYGVDRDETPEGSANELPGTKDSQKGVAQIVARQNTTFREARQDGTQTAGY